jgi:salicylate hydroxylase
MLRVGIVGGGMGGLAAAIALRKRGFEVTIFEQAPELGEIGAGINLTPNAVKVMRALEIDHKVLEISCKPESHLLRSWKSGRVLHRAPISGAYEKNLGAGYWLAHRADLHLLLRQQLPESCIRLNAKVTAVRSSKTEAVVTFVDNTELEFDVVIGADGINSAVRASMFGPEVPRFTGYICWRGTVPVDAMPDGLISPDLHVWLGPKGHVVNYHVRGGSMVNFIAHYEWDGWRSESWVMQADRNEPLSAYAGWNEEMLALFANCTSCFKWAQHDREPLRQWTQGRVTLLGDAAHPMLPNLAQGAAMAFEDGYVLAGALALESNDPEAALRAYEAHRRPRTTQVQLASRARAQVNHLTSPVARLRRDIGYMLHKLLKPNQTSYKAEWIYSYDVRAGVDSLRPSSGTGQEPERRLLAS